MRLSDLFNIVYGQHECHIKNAIELGEIPIISSKSTNNGVHGYYNISPKYSNVIALPNTGNICEATYQKYPCCIDDNCLVLLPKKEMSDREMLWYVLVLRMEKSKYFYGRQVTPTRIRNLEVPMPPDWVEDVELPEFNELNIPEDEILDTTNWKYFNISYLFDMSRGSHGPIPNTKGETPFITSISTNNGVKCYVDSPNPKWGGNCLTVANDGVAGETFYQENPFDCNFAVTILTPRLQRFNAKIGLFFCAILRREKNKYSYDRKFSIERMKQTTIKLPANMDGEPDLDYMEQFIEKLPYAFWV